MIKRLIIMALLFFPLFLAMPHAVDAAFNPLEEACNPDGGTSVPTSGADSSSVCAERHNIDNPLTGPDSLMVRAARLISVVTGIASVIFIVVGGIKYVSSSGDANSVESAKNTVLYALVGLVLSIMAQGIIVFVVNRYN